MRFGPKERRLLNRRLRDRIPPALLIAPKFVLIIAATIYITPEALAELRSEHAEAHLTLDVISEEPPAVYEKTYTKEDLSKKMPSNPVKTLNQRIMEEMNALLQRVRNNQRGSTQRDQHAKLQVPYAERATHDIRLLREAPEWKGDDAPDLKKFFAEEQDRAAYYMNIAKLKEEPSLRTSDGNAIRAFFASEMQKAATDRTRDHIGPLKNLSSGIDFDFDLAKIFESKSSAPTNPRGKVRYGLVLKDVKPDMSAPKRAAISDRYDELRYAGHADVEWTIGPLSEEESIKLTKISSMGTAEKDAASGEGESRSFLGSLWDRLTLPKPAFKGKLKPAAVENLNSVDDTNKLPDVLWEIRQEEGYYTLSYTTKADGTKVSEYHTFRIPIVGTMEYGRRFNDKWQVMQTSLYNILIDKRAPLVSVHYLHFEDQYRATLSHKIDDYQRIGLAYQGKAGHPEMYTDSEERKEKSPEKYSLNYTKRF